MMQLISALMQKAIGFFNTESCLAAKMIDEWA